MGKLILCYDEKNAKNLQKYFNLILENNGFYYFEFNDKDIEKYTSEFSTNDFDVVDSLMLDM